jgi:hypothetical protein
VSIGRCSSSRLLGFGYVRHVRQEHHVTVVLAGIRVEGTERPMPSSYVRRRLKHRKGIDMRKTVAVFIGAVMTLALVGPAAQAGPPHHEAYETRWVNAFWHSRVRVDPDTYLHVT